MESMCILNIVNICNISFNVYIVIFPEIENNKR